MSRINDFDEFLNAQKASKQEAYSARQKNLFAARKKYDGLIGELFVLVRDYHEKIVLPRTPSFLVVKKQEEIASEEEQPLTLIYRANLVPKDFLPPAFTQTDLVERVDYLKPRTVTEYDWHANVALQFSLILENLPESTSETSLRASVKSWGHLTPDTTVPLSRHTTFTHEVDKRTPYTHLTVQGDALTQEAFVQEIENLLILVTPSVLTHREIVWKK